MPLEKLTRARIVEALNLLGRRAETERVELELCIYGGSAMMLAYGAREYTKDVDAIVRPADVAQRLAKDVAAELRLEPDWLSDNVKRFVSISGTFAPLEIQGLEESARRHLKITRPSASYLLAMKCLACRPSTPGYPGDVEDIRFLVRKMGLRTVAEVEAHIERFYPTDALTSESRAVVERILADSAERENE
jgi:hypothetical protein